jgi:hypothetical protein
MKNLKRGRGRPIGSGIRDDRALALVADKIIANPRLKPSTSMRQVLRYGKIVHEHIALPAINDDP